MFPRRPSPRQHYIVIWKIRFGMQISQASTTAIAHLYIPEVLMRKSAVEDDFLDFTEDILNGKFAPRPQQNAGKIRFAESPPAKPEKRMEEIVGEAPTADSTPHIYDEDWFHRDHLPEDITKYESIEASRLEKVEILGEEVAVDTDRLAKKIPPATFDFGPSIGPNNNPWRFWFKLNDSERRKSYHYTPIHLETNTDIGYSRSGYSESENLQGVDLEHLEQNLNVIYYPFGLFSIRLKSSFRFSEPISAERLIELRRAFVHNTRTRNRPDNLMTVIRNEILSAVFAEIPGTYELYEPDLDIFHLTYLYDVSDMGEKGVAKLVADETRDLSSDFIEYKTQNRLGMLEGDQIYMTASGGVLYTPHLDSVSQRSRRTSRIALQNNAYLASDFGMFDQKYVPEIGVKLRDVQQELVDGTLVGLPLEGEGIAALIELFDLPESFRGTRYQMYRNISSREQKEKHQNRIEDLTTLLCQHDSTLRETVKSIPFGGALGALE